VGYNLGITNAKECDMQQAKPLGTLNLPLTGKKYYLITGGPFVNCPDHLVGVKMAQEINRKCDINIPTVDFSTPPATEMRAGLIKAVEQITKGRGVYVGCYAGKGRTGLFLAVLCKAWGIENPVEYVRANYYAHAVETSDQYAYVTRYEIPREVTRMVQIAKLKSFFRFKQNLTIA
jgi:hypothetical protein